MTWIIKQRPWTDPAGEALRLAQRAELDLRYGTDDHEPGPPPTADDIDLFLVAVDDATGQPLGCAALRRLNPVTVEIKRMYVVPARRGSGLATDLLRGLEDAAQERGWTTIRLETGVAQPDAMRFYEREGYREIPLYGAYVGSDNSVCYERVLSDRAPDGGHVVGSVQMHDPGSSAEPMMA
ncbi:GNAT family N-acetyltransferase [Micromonospora sp. CA-246542]|uniref:GNAT family N-acetyltransferase n=1 Tax=Micromonospora sp. CA-246542 TaxID=3239959 RepID=UPI003D8D8BD3